MTKRFDPELLKELVFQVSMSVGIPEQNASLFCDSLVEADVHGISTHGVSRLKVYLERIK